MRTEYFLLLHHSRSILAKLSTYLVLSALSWHQFFPSQWPSIDPSWEGRNTCLWIYALNLIIDHSGELWWEHNILHFFTTPQPFLQSSAPGALSTVVTSVVLYVLTRATLMTPGKDKTRVCGHALWIYWSSTLENTDENEIFFVCLPHHKHFSKAQHQVLWAF